MKNFLLALKKVAVLLLPVLLHVKFSVAGGGVPTVSLPTFPEVFPDVPHIAASLLYWVELGLRVVPTAGNYSLVTLLHDALAAFVPNKAANSAGEIGLHVVNSSTSFRNTGGTGAAAA